MMPDITGQLENASRWLARHRGLILPVVAAAMIFVILVPLPPAVMDVLLVANITLAAIILLTTIYVSTPLEFSVFPSVLLSATLLRLVLNVASTRLVLTAGADGRTIQQAQLAAGKVIWSFSHFVAAGSLTVGVIIFAIVVIIQFIVVTKGAARVSEVAARFVLDAMPGKQMAIDAELNSGVIDEKEARKRREAISRESDFYGAMDGASKFLRGDAVAAVLITLVNICGGIYIGIFQYGWDWPRTLDLFARLTIGDGLVTQIPAFIVSVSAALLVTRTHSKTNLGEQVVSQLVARPIVLVVTAVFLAALSLTQLPKIPLLLMGVGCAGLAYVMSRKKQVAADKADDEETAQPAEPKVAGEIDRLMRVDPMQMEMGFSLIRLIEPHDDESLLDRIATLRRRIAESMGLLVPPIRITDNMKLAANSYNINIRGAKVASGRVYPNMLLAVGGNSEGLVGRKTTEPAFGTPAIWITPDQRSKAIELDCTVVTPTSVLITHLNEVIKRHAADLLSRREVVRLLEGVKAQCGELVAEVSEKLGVGRLQKILQNLLSECVPIRDMETILETLSDEAGRTEDIDRLTDSVRVALARMLTQQYAGDDGELWGVCLDDELETQVGAYVSDVPAVSIPGELAGRVTRAVAEGIEELRRHGRPAVVLCGPTVRTTLKKLIAADQPDAAVLAYNEIDGAQVRSIAKAGTEL